MTSANDTSSEEHRYACEVRHVANMPTDADRNRYLTHVHERRGKAYWERLRADAWNLIRARKVAA